MRGPVLLRLLCSVCFLVPLVKAQNKNCDLSAAKKDVDFPDIESLAIESYKMSVEYTLPNLQQTDYFVEYYDLVERRGRLDAHRGGISSSYIYRTQTWEAWEVTSQNCSLKNVTDTPWMMKGVMSEWTYDDLDDNEKRTFGPSGMFKNALRTWKNSPRGEKAVMGYMGVTPDDMHIRGLKAQWWRRCTLDTAVDYYFTVKEQPDPLGLGLKIIPLRVDFLGYDNQISTRQQYDIISFEPFIQRNVYPFQLPKGKGCRRYPLRDPPKFPDFTGGNLQFSAEVVYRKVNYNDENVDVWSYYSTLTMALDNQAQHLAYYYTPWNSTKPEPGEEPVVLAPEYIIFDMKHGYAYKNNLVKGDCQIIREKSFVPEYVLPNGAGELALTDTSILFPISSLTYLTEGENRGLKVNIFEEIIENYFLDNSTNQKIIIPKAVISHSFLKNNEVERNSRSVQNSLVQVDVRLYGRQENVVEIITMNFFDFDTEIKNRRFVFNTQRCYKNDDDYAWVTIGFNADAAQLDKIKDNVPSIQSNIFNSIISESELNPVRIPTILVDIEEKLLVTMLILGKPPVLLDYLEPEKGKTLKAATDVEGNTDLETCATDCLEQEGDCWAFSLCGAVCSFATKGSTIATDKACTIYRRYNNETFIPSKEQMIRNLRREVETHEITLVLLGLDNEPIQLQATFIEVTEPGEDDRLITRIGNEVNSRLRVVKAGAKLQVTAGKPVKNLGKLSFDECQRECLDYKDCETVSHCVKSGECIVSSQFGDDLDKSLIVDDNLCSVLTRKYSDLFNRSPGNVLSVTAREVLTFKTVEECARACLKSSGYQCLSFDHCPQSKTSPCKLHTVHYPNTKTREQVQVQDTNCGHYYRKFSTEFKKTPNKRYLGSTIPPYNNMTLEECSKACVEYRKGTCFGYDFCQDGAMLQTSCILLDKQITSLKSSYSEVCTNFLRNEIPSAPRPYTNGYAGGIGFLCFIVGLAVGALVLFGIAYIKVNRH